MLKLVTSMACILMLVGIGSTVFAEDAANVNEFITGEVIVENNFEDMQENRVGEIYIQAIKLDNTTVSEIQEEQTIKGTSLTEKIAEETIVLEVAVENAIEETVSESIAEEMIPEETAPKKISEAEMKASYHKGYLTARKGYVTDSPCGPNGNDGQETWYPTHPGGAVKILAREKGFTDLKMTVCKEEGLRYGVRIISGKLPNGEPFEDLIVVAADIRCEYNPDGVFERGQFIETSLGPGLIVDFCERAMNERRYNGITHIDLATNWYN